MSIINAGTNQKWSISAQGVTIMGKTKRYNTYEEMLQSPDPGLFNWVEDASGDPSVGSGSACYRYENGVFKKIHETESMDLNFNELLTWGNLEGAPEASAADIDKAVETAKAITIKTKEDGTLQAIKVNGTILATHAEVVDAKKLAQQLEVVEGEEGQQARLKVDGTILATHKEVVDAKKLAQRLTIVPDDKAEATGEKSVLKVDGIIQASHKEVVPAKRLAQQITIRPEAIKDTGLITSVWVEAGLPLFDANKVKLCATYNGPIWYDDSTKLERPIVYMEPAGSADEPGKPVNTYSIILNNGDMLAGKLTEGNGRAIAASLIRIDNTNTICVGCGSQTTRVKSKDNKVTINGSDTVLTNENFDTYMKSLAIRLDTLEKQLADTRSSYKKEDGSTVKLVDKFDLDGIQSCDREKLHLIIDVAEEQNIAYLKTTLTCASLEIRQLHHKFAQSQKKFIDFSTDGDVSINNFTLTGKPSFDKGPFLRISKAQYIRLTNSTINAEKGYNAFEFGIMNDNGPGVKSILVDNVYFQGKLENNAISIFAVENGAEVTISNCTFEDCSNPIRFTNFLNGKVTLNIVNCVFKNIEGHRKECAEHEEGCGSCEKKCEMKAAGILCLQNSTTSHKTDRIFGKDKVTVNIINCTLDGKKITAPADQKEVCGTFDKNQLVYVYNNQGDSSNLKGYVSKDFVSYYPTVNIL